MTNVFRVDATEIDADGLQVPGDLEDADEMAYELNRSVRSAWAIKVVNGSDEEIEATTLVSTSDDSAFEGFAEDGDPEPAAAGDPPENVAYFTGETVAGYLGVDLTAEATPTEGEVKVVFNSRLYGGA